MKKFYTYDEAKKIIQAFGLKGKFDWQVFTKTDEFKKLNLPADPSKLYKDKGWVSWGDFLGTGTVVLKNKTFLSYDEAKEIAKPMGFKTKSDWDTFTKTSEFKNLNLPANPSGTYKDKGWISWGDFIRTSG